MSHRHSVTEDPIKLVGIAAIAAAIGATVAMLFTPRDGSQVRRGLKRRAEHLKDEVHERFDLTGDAAEETAEDVKKRLQSTAAKVAEGTKTTTRKVSKNAKATKTAAKTTVKAPKTPPRSTS